MNTELKWINIWIFHIHLQGLLHCWKILDFSASDWEININVNKNTSSVLQYILHFLVSEVELSFIMQSLSKFSGHKKKKRNKKKKKTCTELLSLTSLHIFKIVWETLPNYVVFP